MNKYNQKFFPIFFEEETDGQSNGASELFEPLGQQAEPELEVQTQVEKTPAQPDFKAFAAEIGKEFATNLKSQQDQTKPVPQMSEAEVKKLLKVWEPDEAWETKFDNLTTRRAAIQEMRDRIIDQADTIIQARLMDTQQKFQAQFSPVQQMLTQQQTEAAEKKFYSTYEVLDKPSIRANLPAIANQMVSEGAFKGLDQDKSFQALATRVESMIQANHPDFKLSVTKPTQNKPSNALTSVSHGSGGGGGNGGGRPSGPTANRILGAVGQKT